MEGVEDALKKLLEKGLKEGSGTEAFNTMGYRVSFTQSLVGSMIERGGIGFTDWLFKNEGEVGLMQILLPKGLADGLKRMADSHRERCEDCENLEDCKKAGIYDDPVRTILTEILKIGFAELGVHIAMDKRQ